MSKIYKFTEEGLNKHLAELEDLKTNGRRDIAERIKIARGYGDLSENSEYDDAKNEQAMLEARIVTIEATLKNAVIIDEEGISNEHIHVGSKVKLLNLKTDSEVTYKIVGSNEANPSEGKISDESPVGLALLGHAVGDSVEVEVPVGVIGFKVLDIFK